MFGSIVMAAPALLALASALPADSTLKAPTRVAARDPNAVVSAPAAVTVINDNDGIGGGSNTNTPYSGDGSAGAGWPSISQWVSFSDMFNNNRGNFAASCSQYGVPNNSDDEIQSIFNAIEQVAQSSGVDHRFILAIILNESTGCVRVPTTSVAVSGGTIYNPGLMQDHDGHFTCNTATNDEYNQGLGVVSPCPQESITGMIMDGTVGTDAGDGLATLINDAQGAGATDAQIYYLAAQWYNRGAFNPAVGGELSTYASNVANYLTGWLNGGAASGASDANIGK
nr:hypothetical protein CFP56_38989 [Quercus suber]